MKRNKNNKPDLFKKPYLTNPNYLGLSSLELEDLGGIFTAREIQQQPKLWLDTYHILLEQQAAISDFLDGIFALKNLNIILTGAGTSAFIGNILQAPFQKNTGKNTWAIATTDLVTHPHMYFNPTNPTLLVSFGRSGNSPESIAAVDLAESLCENIFHLVITCNPEGELASKSRKGLKSYVLVMPPEAEDKGLAMTGSFSCMLLAGILISRLQNLDYLSEQVSRLSSYGSVIINTYTKELRKLAQLEFSRAVFLGSGLLQGAARESQLKVQELTDGKVICKFDSFLGLRHGPKVVINSSTLLVYLFSNNKHAHQYEMDLVNAINEGVKGLAQIGISEAAIKNLQLDLMIVLSEDGGRIEEEFLSVCSVLPSQILGFYKSLFYGLNPDSPSLNQTITRVVEGVTIYPVPDTGKNEIKINF